MINISISATPSYSPEYSNPENKQFSFIYHISIRNDESYPVKLISRHWTITDGNGHIKEVKGPGVVGEQPTIAAGEIYQYTSSVAINTEVGTMGGCYQMADGSGVEFDIPIPIFLLSVPGILH